MAAAAVGTAGLSALAVLAVAVLESEQYPQMLLPSAVEPVMTRLMQLFRVREGWR